MSPNLMQDMVARDASWEDDYVNFGLLQARVFAYSYEEMMMLPYRTLIRHIGFHEGKQALEQREAERRRFFNGGR